MGRRIAAVVLAVLSLAGVGVAVAQVSFDDGRIGPAISVLDNGRRLQPFGKLAPLGNFPTGGRVTPNGRWLWTVSSGRGPNDIRIVSVRTGKRRQMLSIPGASGGIAMDPVRPLVYVSGVADSRFRGQDRPAGTPGTDGDVIHVYSYAPGTGRARFERVLSVPPPPGAPAMQAIPPTTRQTSWPDRLAVSPDGQTLLVPLNLADAAAIVDSDTGDVRYVSTGTYPYGAAILRDGVTGLVSNEAPGTVSVVNLATGAKVRDIQVGPHLSHPGSITLDPKAARAYVTLANSDQVAVIDTRRMAVQRTLSVERPEGIGASPVDAAVTGDGTKLVVADEGSDELAVFQLPVPEPKSKKKRKHATARRSAAVKRAPAPWTLIGRIPTAQMPMAVAVVSATRNPCGLRRSERMPKRSKRCTKLLYVSGKGLGTGANPNGPRPVAANDNDDTVNQTQYLPNINMGVAGLGDLPGAAAMRRLTPVAARAVTPLNAVADPPAGTPLRPGGPIRHVFFIVRENRTYDQVLGDDPRGDGDPNLTLFGTDTTPNAHALAQRFPLLDHVYADSEASIDGHYWTSAAQVSDYVHKAWFQNYAGRGRPYDFGAFAVSWPQNGFLFDQAARQGISYFNYGEAMAGVTPIPDKDRTPDETAGLNDRLAHSDLGPNGCFPSDASIGTDSITGQPVFDSDLPDGARSDSESRFRCFQSRFTSQVNANAVPAFNYLTLTNDHTETLRAGARTPRAMIADNDEAVGRIADLISHSPIWRSSAIFVVEDDSQDGADHVDAHRIPALVVSPYARRGAVVHTRYDFLSVVHSMELILGMHPLGLFDALGTPMYDAFQPTPDAEPYTFAPARVPLLETNPSGTPGAVAAARLPKCLDCIPQSKMDALLWKSVHGQSAVSPPPGPNASGADDDASERQAEASLRRMIRAARRGVLKRKAAERAAKPRAAVRRRR